MFVILLRFYTYGDLPLEKHLKMIEDQALKSFDRLSTDTQIMNEPKWKEPVRFTDA